MFTVIPILELLIHSAYVSDALSILDTKLLFCEFH